MGISINGPSGIDTSYIIDSLVSLEQQKITRVEDRQDIYQGRIDAYSKLDTFLGDLESNLNKIQDLDSFEQYSTTSSNDDIVTINTTSGGVAGSYDVNVFQTATHEKLISGDSLVTDQNAALSTFGISAGTFSINGTEITLDANDTLQDLRSKINSTTDADGKSIGVTATVLKLSDTNYRMVLTSSDTGKEGSSYLDIGGGTVLQDLGIINDAAGDKGVTNQALRSDTDVNAAFAAMAIGETITYSGIDSDGNNVSNTFVKSSSNTIDDFVEQVEATFHGMADISIDGADGTLLISDKTGGSSALNISSFNIAGVDQTFTMEEVGSKGSNVLSVGKDAYFSIDGLHMESTKNTASGYITGVDLEFHKASYDESINIEMERDYDGITNMVKSVVGSYNALVRFVSESTGFANPDDEESVSGALSGDMTTRSILSQIRSVFSSQLDVTGNSEFSAFTMVGLSTNTLNSEFKFDESEFKDALKNNFEDTISLFATKGYADTSAIIMGNYNDDTSEGVYNLVEVDADHYEVTVGGETFTSDPRMGDVVKFSTGPLEGLMLTAPSGSGDTQFTFSKGLTGRLKTIIDKLTDSHEGTVAMRKESWRKSIDRLDDKIFQLEDRIESYRMRLVKEFAAMEQTMSALNSQSANMMSQLGFYSQ